MIFCRARHQRRRRLKPRRNPKKNRGPSNLRRRLLQSWLPTLSQSRPSPHRLNPRSPAIQDRLQMPGHLINRWLNLGTNRRMKNCLTSGWETLWHLICPPPQPMSAGRLRLHSGSVCCIFPTPRGVTAGRDEADSWSRVCCSFCCSMPRSPFGFSVTAFSLGGPTARPPKSLRSRHPYLTASPTLFRKKMNPRQ